MSDLAKAESISLSRYRREDTNVQFGANSAEGLSVKYTLLTVNSSGCGPVSVDTFPVRVQYRTVTSMEVASNGSSVGQWTDLQPPTSEPGQFLGIIL